MNGREIIRRAGSVFLASSLGVLCLAPLRSSWAGNPGGLLPLLPLYGVPFLFGYAEIVRGFHRGDPRSWNARLALVLALLANLWLVVWCTVWLVVIGSQDTPAAEAALKHMAYLHLFGVGIAMASTVLAFRVRREDRAPAYLFPVGWACAYVGFMDWAFSGGSPAWMGSLVLGGLSWVFAEWGFWKPTSMTGPPESPSNTRPNH